jgi:hypothetical protein
MPLFIKVRVPTQENERSRIYERNIDFAPFYDFAIVFLNCSNGMLFCISFDFKTRRLTCYVIDNKNVDIKISAHDPFL